MKELIVRAVSGALFVSLFLLSLQSQHAVIALFFVFGVICIAEFNKLIHEKGNLHETKKANSQYNFI